ADNVGVEYDGEAIAEGGAGIGAGEVTGEMAGVADRSGAGWIVVQHKGDTVGAGAVAMLQQAKSERGVQVIDGLARVEKRAAHHAAAGRFGEAEFVVDDGGVAVDREDGRVTEIDGIERHRRSRR